MMNYTVTVNPTKRSVTVEYKGYKGTARCCPTDTFDLTVGTELALERAKVAKATAIKEKENKIKNPPLSIMELIKALEKALPVGEMIIVGNGKELTAEQKKWLATLAGVPTKCHCPCRDCNEEDGAYERGYDDGYGDGSADAQGECEECEYQYTEVDMDNAVEEAYNNGYAEAVEDMQRKLANM
jgi:hypothetical protein